MHSEAHRAFLKKMYYKRVRKPLVRLNRIVKRVSLDPAYAMLVHKRLLALANACGV